MNPDQYTLATGCLAGASLLLHLISAGNFLPDEEVWLLGTIFWYVHYWVNFVARAALLGSSAVIGAEIYKPNSVTNLISISHAKLKIYLTKMLAVATLCIFIRFITPGPVTSFSFFYKLCFMTSLSATVVTIVEDGGAGAKDMVASLKRARAPGFCKKAKSDNDDDGGDFDEDRKRRLGRPKKSFKNQ